MKKLLLGLFMVPCMFASQKEQSMRIFVTTNEGQKVRLYHNTDGFFVKTHGKKQEIEPAMLDKNLRNINNAQLKALVNNGSLNLNKTSDGSYSLRAHVHGKGGGWLSGIIAYVAVKAVLSPVYLIPGGAAYSGAVEAVAQGAQTLATACDRIP